MSKRKRSHDDFTPSKKLADKLNLITFGSGSGSGSGSNLKKTVYLFDRLPNEMIESVATQMAKLTTTENLTETILAFHNLNGEFPFTNTVKNWSTVYSNVYNFDSYLPNRTMPSERNIRKSIDLSKQYSSNILPPPRHRNAFDQDIPILSNIERKGYESAIKNSEICPEFMKLLNNLTLTDYMLLGGYFYEKRWDKSDWNEVNRVVNGKISKYFTRDEYYNKQCYKFHSLKFIVNNHHISKETWKINTPDDLLDDVSRGVISSYTNHLRVKRKPVPSRIVSINQINHNTIKIVTGN